MGTLSLALGWHYAGFLNTYLPQAISHYIVHYIICLGNDSSVRKHLKSIIEWLSVNKNKFYTLTQVWRHSYKEPVIHYFPDTPVKNHYIDLIQRERAIRHSRAKNNLKDSWILISKNRCYSETLQKSSQPQEINESRKTYHF